MSDVLEFKLTQKATKKGGDKYECTTNESFIIYVPQTISRTSENVCETLKITITKE